MRVEPHAIGSFVHALKRGARSLPIYNEKADLWRYVRVLYYMNDEYSDRNWSRDSAGKGLFFRPDFWPERKPLVKILCYSFMPNHIHLYLQELLEGGISRFMKKLGESITKYFNEKYNSKGKGTIFQGGYKGKTVKNESHHNYLWFYIMVKNVFELYPKGGLEGAIKDFDKAWEWGITYPFSSLPDYALGRNSLIIDKSDLLAYFPTVGRFKAGAKDFIEGRKWEHEPSPGLSLE